MLGPQNDQSMITEHPGLDPKGSPGDLHKSYKSVPLEDKAFERLVRSIATKIRRAKRLGTETWNKVVMSTQSRPKNPFYPGYLSRTAIRTGPWLR